MNLVRQCLEIAQDPWHTRWICPLLLVADAALCALVIWRIPYTEIDWIAYMQQVSQYIKGERDYIKIQGDTGPLVYPAAHVYIYRLLYGWTDKGRDIAFAQYIFGVLYLLSLAVVMACYRMAKVPPYVFPMLILSKRLHSIFVLRCFNDCFAIFFLFLAIYCFQKRQFTLGSLIYSLGLGVKMSLLLALPAIACVLYQAVGPDAALKRAALMGQLQIVLAWPFAMVSTKGYLSRAFEFTRQFFYKWTVNWRFVREDVFLSREFSLALLAAHASLIILFATTRWLKPYRTIYTKNWIPEVVRSLVKQPPSATQRAIESRVTPCFMLTTILSANAIGMLCARSLHYQFYSWIAWATPVLLWQAGFHPILQYVFWGMQEYAWNVYPSTNLSSMIVVGVLAITVAGVWYGTGKDEVTERSPKSNHVE